MKDITLVIPAKFESDSLPKVLNELKQFSVKKIKDHKRKPKIFGKLEILREFTFIFKNSKTFGCIQIVSFF